MPSRRELHNLYTNRRWRRRARLEKAASPVCVVCWDSGITNPAEVSHHVEDFGDDRFKFFTSPVISLCRHHHELTHGRGDQRDYDLTIDASGWPCDPRHPANRQELKSVSEAKQKLAAARRKKR
jgi:5-methylcytosine-specific restriction enzyme A